MATLTKKEAKKLKGKYYYYSDPKINYAFHVHKSYKTYCTGVKIVITSGFASMVCGVIALDSLHQNNFKEITKEQFNEVLGDVTKIRNKYL